MINDKENKKISKFLSLVLRHKPEAIGITLDENSWTDVTILINKAASSGMLLNREVLRHIVDTNSKKRFAFDSTLQRIRANQGHSVTIELGYQPQKPPEIRIMEQEKNTFHQYGKPVWKKETDITCI